MKTMRILGIGAFCGSIALASLVPAAAVWAKSPPADPVEARIEAMRTSFHITDAQQSLWNNVAQAMRDNAKAMMELRKARGEHAPPLSAVDELKAYSAAVDTHADGLHKFVPVFQGLYDSMSDAQKKTADAKFRSEALARAQRGK